jgi:hypothetical protein
MSTPSYEFTDVWFFSDEEGGNPFRFDEDTPEQVLGQDMGVPEKMNAAFEMKERGFITGLKGETGLVFLGDLVDNERYSLRLLKNMIKLKNEYKERVLLIGGNRDFNKIRIGFELFLQHPVTKEVPWQAEGVVDAASLVGELSNPYKFRSNVVPDYLKDVLKPWDDNMTKRGDKPGIEPVYNSGLIPDRVELLFAVTMGAGNGSFYSNEMIEMLGLPKDLSADVVAKLNCTIQMVMAFEWKGLPKFLEQFNGLYIRYLRASHVIAHFQLGDKHGVVSHGGLPNKFDAGKGAVEHRLTSPFGFKYTTPGFKQVAGFRQIIEEIEAEKNKMCDAVDALRDIGLDEADKNLYDQIARYVHLTAGTVLPCDASSEASPIVGMQLYAPKTRRGDVSLQLGGAATWVWKQLLKVNADKSGKQVGPGTIFDYDIFGHAPQGFLPTAYRESKTLYVNLDISKADAQTNTYSFAMLHLTDTINEFVGRVKLTDNAKTTKYTNRVDNKGQIVYYTENIPYGEKIDKDNTRMIPNQDVNISFKYGGPAQGFVREIKNSTAITNIMRSGQSSEANFVGGRRRNRQSRRRRQSRRKQSNRRQTRRRRQQ